MLLRLGGIQDRFDPAPQAATRFRAWSASRLEDGGGTSLDANLVDRQIADGGTITTFRLRAGVGAEQCHPPLCSVLIVAPFGRLGSEIGFRGFAKGRLRGRGRLALAASRRFFDRIDARRDHFLARRRGDRGRQPPPPPRASGRDDQVQAVAIAVRSSLGRPSRFLPSISPFSPRPDRRFMFGVTISVTI